MNAAHPTIGQFATVVSLPQSYRLSDGKGIVITFRPSSLTGRMNVREINQGKLTSLVCELEAARTYYRRLVSAGFKSA